jgi:hypothetical protein
MRAARDVARAASQLASEAAALARIYEDHGSARESSAEASEAAVRAAQVSFGLDRDMRAGEGRGQDAAAFAIQASLASLEAASAAVIATRAALDAAFVFSHGAARESSDS